jgi:hypothetical protein
LKSRLLLVVAGCAALTACHSLSMPKLWPFHKKPKPAPVAVTEVNLVLPDGTAASYPQYWKRNMLIIDLSGVSGQGSVAARLPEETTWPVRMALRVRPGSVGQLEVQAEERNVLPVSTSGGDAVDIELAPSVYAPRTAAIYISWAPQAAAVETAPTVEEPEFVSPTELPKAAEDAASASDIVPPAEVAPAQPAPPPGD